MRITVIIPTYRRPIDLLKGLDAQCHQLRAADEIIVVVRDVDTETWNAIESYDTAVLPLRIVTVRVPGVVAAMNTGLEIAQGDIIAFTDDDSVPHSDWLKRIEQHFETDLKVGGVGGRDYVYHGTLLEDGACKEVGKLSWFGRMTGNHHIGIGGVREVDILKGVNMSFRRTAINEMRFDARMRGSGAQVHFELAFCLALKRRGWKLIYDPKVAVDHFPAQRFDEDQRKNINSTAVMNAVHNETLVLLEHLQLLRRTAFLIWSLLVGTQQSFGLLQWFRFVNKDGYLASQKLFASFQGRWQGWQSWWQH